MRIHNFFAHKKRAQAMVEFAIALPVLLLLLYGILEAGRLLFLYSTVVTASRQAARYGTTTGDGGGATPVYGAPRPTVPRYQDCAGIRGAANAVGYLNKAPFTISLQYDKGQGQGTTPYCPTSLEVDPSLSEPKLDGNSTRLVVTVSQEFTPIVPKLVPFIQRTISATSARTILYKVPIVVDQPPIIVPQSPTTTTISDTPHPSQMGQQVTMTVKVEDTDDPTNYPQGTVEVTGAFDGGTCIIALGAGSNGIGTCTVTYSNSGTWTVGAVYTPNDDDHLPSVGTHDHLVEAANTITEFISVTPEPSLENQQVTVAVRVTGGSTTPTGTVNIDGGPGSASCQFNLAGGSGGCVISYNKEGWKTINATYSGDASHKASTATPIAHQVMSVTPTARPTFTVTPIPTSTPIPTPTFTPTALPTAVTSCSGITHGTITYAGNQMSMTISNPFPFTLVMKDVTVTWNDDKGHKTGSDKTLKLQVAWVNGVAFWTGNIGTQSTYTLASPQTFGPGQTTIKFTFNQTYDNPETTDRIYINWLTPGCESNPVDSNLP